MSDSINEQRCKHGCSTAGLHYDQTAKLNVPCPGPSVVTPPAQDERTNEKENHMRSARREDGWPTRSDIRYDTDAERLIRVAMQLVEGMGASGSLTRAVFALDAARNHVADHVETEGDNG